jgi:hypothetical protein
VHTTLLVHIVRLEWLCFGCVSLNFPLFHCRVEGAVPIEKKHVPVFPLFHCRVEGAVPIEKKHVPVFAQQANIFSVDTLEGMLCTHEVN